MASKGFVGLFSACLIFTVVLMVSANAQVPTFSSSNSVPLASAVSGSPNPVLLGENFNISAFWYGGTPPYTVYLHTSSVTPNLLCSNAYPQELAAATMATSARTPYSTALLSMFSPDTPAIYLCLVVNDSAGHTSQTGPVTVSITKTPIPALSSSIHTS